MCDLNVFSGKREPFLVNYGLQYLKISMFNALSLPQTLCSFNLAFNFK